MKISDTFKDLSRQALSSIDEATELDEQVVKWVGSRRSKLRFFWKAGKTTTILLMSVPAAVALVVGFGLGSYWHGS